MRMMRAVCGAELMDSSAEAHLTDEASGERIFLGNFGARENAARAFDAAALKQGTQFHKGLRLRV